MCDYKPSVGVLIKNNIVKHMNGFQITYTIWSTYQDTKTNYICENIDHHDVSSYDEASEIAEKTIGLYNTIYIPENIKQNKNCVMHYDNLISSKKYRSYFLYNIYFLIVSLTIFYTAVAVSLPGGLERFRVSLECKNIIYIICGSLLACCVVLIDIMAFFLTFKYKLREIT